LIFYFWGLQSDLVKEAATGAVVRAVIAVPVPVVGQVAGAVVVLTTAQAHQLITEVSNVKASLGCY